MPTYEYECRKCGHRFERFQSISDKPVKTCPKCKGRRVKRLVGGGAGLLFKGSGFHSTDYRSSSYREGAKQEKKSGADADSGSGKDASSKKEGGKAKDAAGKSPTKPPKKDG
jgi:putative FmdB family regulatory protein